MSTATKKLNSPHQPTGMWIRPEKRLAIYLRDRFLCLYCLTDLHSADPRDITLDHIQCQSNGHHDHSPANLVTACRSCNCSRQDKPLARFASPETRKHVRRNTARQIKPYVVLAKALISGETGLEDTLRTL